MKAELLKWQTMSMVCVFALCGACSVKTAQLPNAVRKKLSPPDNESPAYVINFSDYDLNRDTQDKIVDQQVPYTDKVAVRAVDFRYLKAAGVSGAIFRTSRIVKGETRRDRSFNTWAPHAAKNGVLVGAYHYVYQTGTVEKEVWLLLDQVWKACSANPELQNVPVLLVLDADKDTDIFRMAACVELVKKHTGRYPGLYPENQFVESQLAAHYKDPKYAEALNSLSSCWLWRSSYSKRPLKAENGKQAWIWNDYDLWQYCSGEPWYRNGIKVNGNIHVWNPMTMTRKDWFETSLGRLPLNKYPIGFAGSALPLEINIFDGDGEELQNFWLEHAVLPQKPPNKL